MWKRRSEEVYVAERADDEPVRHPLLSLPNRDPWPQEVAVIAVAQILEAQAATHTIRTGEDVALYDELCAEATQLRNAIGTNYIPYYMDSVKLEEDAADLVSRLVE